MILTNVRQCITMSKLDKFKIECLIVEEDRPFHILKHKVTIEEVSEIISKDYVYIQAKHSRWQLIGKTRKHRFLTLILGKRSEKNTYGLVTARPASRKERSFYNEFTFQLGGEESEDEGKQNKN